MTLMSVVRPLVVCVAVWSIVTGNAGGAFDGGALRASERPFLTLNLRFTSLDALSFGTRAGLMTETESLWKPGHVRVKWLSGDKPAQQPGTLRVLVMARPAPQATESSPWTVGELLRPQGSSAVAIASTIGAQRVVDAGRWDFTIEPPEIRDYRLGVVLGRAVAHEIGHYILQTNTHAREGLMRARIDAREFADLESVSFRLDDAAEAHLAVLAEKGTFPDGTAAFSYASH